MTWSERMKLAWTTFKREALPLYTWTLIFMVTVVILFIGMIMGVIRRMSWAFPRTYGGTFSSGMPVPGVPPTSGVAPFASPFGFPANFFGAFNGPFSNFSTALTALGSVVGVFLLILFVAWLLGSAFYTGLFNLTNKAYREKASFKDFHLKGFFRILGWQVIIFLIELAFLSISLIGIFALRNSHGLLVAFVIVYGLLLTAVGIYALPWLNASAIYLLANPQERFWHAFTNSWRFFQRHMGSLWGYIGTVLLIQVALQVLSRISGGIGGIAALVVSPFIAVLAIVWYMSLEESPFLEQAKPEESTSLPIEPKIDLQKGAITQPVVDDQPHFCPSCGKANTGTAYCPQCGTKL